MKSLSLASLLALCFTATMGAEPAHEAVEAVMSDPDARNVRPVQPRVITEPTRHDTDDPAIWINPSDPAASLVIGTDKDVDGALYVFGLDGKVQWDKTVRGLLRPNNVDIAYGLMVGGQRIDIAVTTERYAHRLRVFRLPDMVAIDGGGIPVFEGERARDCMGVALYTRPADGAVFAVVSRSDEGAPQQGYLEQIRLVDDGTGKVQGLLSRRFGTWSGKKEIEAIGVDNEHGMIYYADERFGIRSYAADPAAEDANDELGIFGQTGFAADREGISFYKRPNGEGYILVSNQQADTFRVYSRTGDHAFVGSVRVATRESDGSDLVSTPLPGFPGGLFVAMSTDRTFHFYAWDDLAAALAIPLR